MPIPPGGDSKKSSIDRVRRSLYTRRAPILRDPRHDIHSEQSEEVAEDWAGGKDIEQTFTLPSPRKTYKVFFWCALAVFLVSMGVAAYSFFGGSVFVSSNNVDMTVTGPVSVAGGDPVNFTVSVENKNKTDIQSVDLVAEFPVGVKNPSAPTEDVGRQDSVLGTIGAGQVAQGPFSAIFFGSQGSVITVKFIVEYRTADSNAVFYKEKDIQITIASSPLTVSVDGLDSVNAGQPMTLIFNVSSNSANVVSGVALQLQYPFGWTTLSTDPSPSSGQNTWNLGDLAPGATTTVSVSGKIDGQNGDKDTIGATVGLTNQQGSIATTIVSAQKIVAIEKPFLSATLSLDGQTSDSYAAPVGRTVNATINWSNTGATRITNGQIVVALSGTAFDPSSVNTPDGYYDSQSDTITWDGGRIPSLALIAPNDSGQLHFSFASLPNIQNQNNASIDLDISAKGQRIDQSNVPQNISSELTRAVKIVSNISLSSRAVRASSVMSNGGAFPPKANQVTDYTVVWTAANTSNAVSGVRVSTTLPPYVTFTGINSPTSADISYSSSTGAFMWNVGALASGATAELDFQVALKPNITQVGSTPILIGGSTITGTDNFAGVPVTSTALELTTILSNDPTFAPGDETVGQ